MTSGRIAIQTYIKKLLKNKTLDELVQRLNPKHGDIPTSLAKGVEPGQIESRLSALNLDEDSRDAIADTTSLKFFP